MPRPGAARLPYSAAWASRRRNARPRSYPHQFSGGMRQRVVLAMGMSNEPALLLADEPTTALDVTIQAQILDLMRALHRDYGTAIVLISHDLGVIAGVCARVLVMYAGEVVEEGNGRGRAGRAAPPLHLGADERGTAAGDGGGRTAAHDRRHAAGPAQHAAGLPIRAALPVPDREMRRAPAAIPHGTRPRLPLLGRRRGRALPKAQHRPRAPPRRKRPGPGGEKPLLQSRGLVKYFPVAGGFFGKRRVVHAGGRIDLDIYRGEVMGVVGESGCGKSTLGRTLMRLYRPDSGRILFDGTSIETATQSEIRPLRRRLQMVFQDPYASLNPRMTVGETLGEPLRFHGLTADGKATTARVRELLGTVGLAAAAADRYPHEFSGGQRQRVAIARALATNPDFIVADEPISALDVNIQAQIINLMMDLQAQFGLTYMFIAHDLAVVRHISDRVMVLHLGKVAELAPAADLFAAPLHPYTRYLISAIPEPDAAAERARQRVVLQGEAASAIDPPSGCRFRTRCPLAQKICAEVDPPPLEHRPSHFAACHFAGQN